jgi:TRAP-type mannitol/chloroaromatic compound transport system permease small subunit
MNIYKRIIEYLALAGGLLVFVMSVMTSFDILGRKALMRGVPGCYELVQYMLVFVVFFAVAYSESQEANVRVELFYAHYPQSVQRAVSILSSLSALVIFCLIVYTSAVYGWESWTAKETMYGLEGGPLYVWKFGVPFGCIFMCIQLIKDMVGTMKQMIAGS